VFSQTLWADGIVPSSPVRAPECLFFFNDTATTEIYTLSLHDALPIYASASVSNGDAPITLNQTGSPQLPPRGCIGVLAVINTNDIAPQSILTLTLTARSNAA